jgi:hypothetical protein
MSSGLEKFNRAFNKFEKVMAQPEWPRFSDVPESGHAIYHAMADGIKPYLRELYGTDDKEPNTENALKYIEEWATLANELIENNHIHSNQSLIMLLELFRYYSSLVCDFSKIQKA